MVKTNHISPSCCCFMSHPNASHLSLSSGNASLHHLSSTQASGEWVTTNKNVVLWVIVKKKKWLCLWPILLSPVARCHFHSWKFCGPMFWDLVIRAGEPSLGSGPQSSQRNLPFFCSQEISPYSLPAALGSRASPLATPLFLPISRCLGPFLVKVSSSAKSPVGDLFASF